MNKTELNSIYGVMARKYIDTDLNSIYPNNDFVLSLDDICNKLISKLHANITYYLALLDNQLEFTEKYAVKEEKKNDSCFYHLALETHHCYNEVVKTVFEISNLLIPFDMRYGTSYNHFMREVNKAKDIGHEMFRAIYTIDGYKKFALEVRKSLLD